MAMGEKLRTHIVPLGGDEPIHAASSKCFCQPLVEEETGIVTHHAQDLREKFERNGIKYKNKPWGLFNEINHDA
jgi:hypothetical protein